MNSTINCPCGSEKLYSACCGPYIEGKQAAPTPETLMRSRYSAFTLAEVDYIANTMRGPVAAQFEAEGTRKWTQQVTWLGLQVNKAPPVLDNHTQGFVEFTIRYRFQGKIETIHENSEFEYENGRWYYVDGHTPQRDKAVKIGRNDPCPCGSGKKFKKCCQQMD